eukprot:1021185-Rhodomonas_salina.1
MTDRDRLWKWGCGITSLLRRDGRDGYKSLGANDNVLDLAPERALELVQKIGPSRSSPVSAPPPILTQA